MDRKIELPALRRAADLLPSTLNEEDLSIEVVWSTGSRVRRQPLFGEPFDEELSMDPASVRLGYRPATPRKGTRPTSVMRVLTTTSNSLSPSKLPLEK